LDNVTRLRKHDSHRRLEESLEESPQTIQNASLDMLLIPAKAWCIRMIRE
jgi:hypothetical protein